MVTIPSALEAEYPASNGFVEVLIMLASSVAIVVAVQMLQIVSMPSLVPKSTVKFPFGVARTKFPVIVPPVGEKARVV